MNKKCMSIAIVLSCYANGDVLKNTQIRTISGVLQAQSITEGSVLESVTKTKKQHLSVTVNTVGNGTTDSVVEITIDGKVIMAPRSQTFFDPVLNKWVKSHEISTNNHLMGSDMKPIKVLDCVQHKGRFETVKLGVDGSSYFFADGVLTHNFWPVLVKIGIFVAHQVASSIIDNRVQAGADSIASSMQGGNQQTKDHSTGQVTHVHHHHHHHHHIAKSTPTEKPKSEQGK